MYGLVWITIQDDDKLEDVVQEEVDKVHWDLIAGNR